MSLSISETAEQRPCGGELLASISRRIVQLLARYAGKGPTHWAGAERRNDERGRGADGPQGRGFHERLPPEPRPPRRDLRPRAAREHLRDRSPGDARARARGVSTWPTAMPS